MSCLASDHKRTKGTPEANILPLTNTLKYNLKCSNTNQTKSTEPLKRTKRPPQKDEESMQIIPKDITKNRTTVHPQISINNKPNTVEGVTACRHSTRQLDINILKSRHSTNLRSHLMVNSIVWLVY